MVRDKPTTLGTTIPADLTDQLSTFTGAFIYGKIDQKTGTKNRGIVFWCI